MATVNYVHSIVCFLFANPIFCDTQRQHIADYFPISQLLSSDKKKKESSSCKIRFYEIWCLHLLVGNVLLPLSLDWLCPCSTKSNWFFFSFPRLLSSLLYKLTGSLDHCIAFVAVLFIALCGCFTFIVVSMCTKINVHKNSSPAAPLRCCMFCDVPVHVRLAAPLWKCLWKLPTARMSILL